MSRSLPDLRSLSQSPSTISKRNRTIEKINCDHENVISEIKEDLNHSQIDQDLATVDDVRDRLQGSHSSGLDSEEPANNDEALSRLQESPINEPAKVNQGENLADEENPAAVEGREHVQGVLDIRFPDIVEEEEENHEAIDNDPTDEDSNSHPFDLDESCSTGEKNYDYLLKVLLVGDSDVGKREIIGELEDGTLESPFCSSEAGPGYKQTTILIDGKRVRLLLWDTSGQGRFCTIIRSYSRGAQGIILVYDITNRWSFEGIDRWIKEVDQHAPGIPKVLIGNRLHLAFRRQVDQRLAEDFAEKHGMGFFEVSSLVNFNVSESFVEVARMALTRNGMERLWKSSKVSSLYELCAHAIVNRTTVYGIDRLPVPPSIRQSLKSYSLTSYSTLRRPNGCGGGSGVISAVTNSYNKQSSQKSRRNNTFRETSKISNLSFKFKTRRGGQTSGSASSSANTASSRETKKAICVLS